MSKFVVCSVEACENTVHEVYAQHHNGQCMKCVRSSQEKKHYEAPITKEELNQLFRKKMVRGNTLCGCGAQIPVSKVGEWEGKCPRCRGVKQKSNRVVLDNKFKSLEEFNASKQQTAGFTQEQLMALTKKDMIFEVESYLSKKYGAFVELPYTQLMALKKDELAQRLLSECKRG